VSAASSSDDGFQWLEAASVADSLNVEDDDEVPALADDTPDWLTEAESESGVTDGGWDDGAADVQQPMAEEPAWLSAVKSSAPAPDASEFQWDAPSTHSESVPEWLTTLESQPEGEVPPPENANQDWLSDAKPVPTAADLSEWMHRVPEDTAEPTAVSDLNTLEWTNDTAVHDDTPDWLAEPEQEFAPEAETMDHSDWLGNIGSDRAAAQQEASAEPLSSEFSWLNDMNPSATGVPAGEPKLVPVEEMEADFGEMSTSLDDLARVDESGVVAASSPANNAPDWLNAMVPGLDVDFDAPEDEQIESEFLPGSENRMSPEGKEIEGMREQRDFAWLEAIVEEESQQIAPVDMEALKEKRPKRFSFSRLPPWLRQPLEKPQAPAAPAADDIDLPPWLQ
jgi:hypothetical protein